MLKYFVQNQETILKKQGFLRFWKKTSEISKMPLVLKKYKQLGNFLGVIICSLSFVFYKKKVKSIFLFINQKSKRVWNFVFFFAFFWLSKILTYFSPKNKLVDCHERYYFYIGFEIIVFWRKKIWNEPFKLWFLFFFDKISVSKFSDFQKLKKKKKKTRKFFNHFFLDM